MEKVLLRKEIKRKREALSEEYKRNSSEMICRFLESSPLFEAASDIFVYVSEANEPDTADIIKAALKTGKTVYVPKCIKKGVMIPVEINADTVFSSGYMGIREPLCFNESIGITEIDLSVIPCVSASYSGERLGHGAGFYDIFLKNTVTKKVCLCFDELISENIPTEECDIPMDIIITEKGITDLTGAK